MLFVKFLLCRGESFRQDYGKLGELRSVVPDGVKFMALTATASPLTREGIIQSLFISQPRLVYATPQKKNIIYIVKQKVGLEEFVQNIATQLLSLLVGTCQG